MDEETIKVSVSHVDIADQLSQPAPHLQGGAERFQGSTLGCWRNRNGVAANFAILTINLLAAIRDQDGILFGQNTSRMKLLIVLLLLPLLLVQPVPWTPSCDAATYTITPKNLVNLAYHRLLERNPTESELNRELKRITAVDPSFLMEAFVDVCATDEFITLYRSRKNNEAKLEFLYDRFLRRAPEMAGKKSWLSYMNIKGNDPDDVAATLFGSFSQSEELQNQIGTTHPWVFTQPKKLNEFQISAQICRLRKKKQEAIDNLQKAIKLGSKSAVDYVALGEFTRTSQPAEATNLFSLATKLDPTWSKPYAALFDMLILGQKEKDALNVISEGISLNACPELLNRRARFLQLTMRYDEAARDWSRSLTLDPKQKELKDILHQRAECYVNAEESDQALKDIDAAIGLGDRSASAYEVRGQIHLADGHAAAAVEDYTHAIELKPSNDVYYKRGLAYDRLQKFEAAASDYRMAIKNGPNKGHVYFLLAEAEKKAGHIQAALASYSKAIELDKNTAEAYAERANLYAKLGESALAAADRAKALSRAHRLEQEDGFWASPNH
jgi:tetratricopeptide (TPR) repeat protein